MFLLLIEVPRQFLLQQFCHITTKALYLVPVSYTHLDVYKRQIYYHAPNDVRDALISALLSTEDSGEASNLMSVSYTHLDVYKRQGKSFWLRKKRSLKQSSKEQRSSNTRTVSQKASKIFLKNTGKMCIRDRNSSERAWLLSGRRPLAPCWWAGNWRNSAGSQLRWTILG